MIDTIIVCVLLISVLIGWFRGAVKEFCSVISWIGSGFLAYKLFPVGLDIVREFIDQPILANIITGVSLFVIFLIVLSLLTYIFSKIVNESVFSTVDKFCGSLFGLVRGLLVLSIAEFGSTYYIFKEPPEIIKQSNLLPYIKNTAQMMFLLLPEKTQRDLMNYSSKDKQQELIRALGGKLKETIIASQDKNNSEISTGNQLPSPLSGKSVNRNSESFVPNVGSSSTTSSSATSTTASNSARPLKKEGADNSESKTAKELARLGIKKSEANPNLSKSVRSDLDKFIDQNID